ncbi:hypothetical protein F4819DRAFT_484317 [Hypoxylon fuscum]|nr:hypothetical protein F4819DRAFT_484317 [Hypoxylon fuscum]
MKRARQWATTNIGFPTAAANIVVKDVVNKSHINHNSPGVDIKNIKDAKGCEIEDATSFICDHRHGKSSSEDNSEDDDEKDIEEDKDKEM